MPRLSPCRACASRCRYSLRIRPTTRWRSVKDKPVIALTLDAGLQQSAGRSGARPRGRVGSEYFRRHSCGRQRQRRRARTGRLAGLFRRPPRRPGRHDPRGALAGIDAEAVHLWSRLRGRLRSSGKPDRRPADPLRLLRAGKFRHDLPGHGSGAQGAANVAQRAGGRIARPRRRQPVVVAAETGRSQSGVAERRGARIGDGPRRRRDHVAGPCAALFGTGAAWQHAAVAGDRRPAATRRGNRSGCWIRSPHGRSAMS